MKVTGIWAVAVVLVAFVVVLSGCVGQNPVGTPAATTPVATTAAPKTQTLVTKSPLEMLPTRDDLSTEWVIMYGSGQSLDEIPYEENATGFVSGASTQLTKVEATSYVGVAALIYRFNSVENANNYHQTKVNQYKQVGGYTELPISGMGADCYGGKTPYGSISLISIYCVKNNVAFYLYSGSYSSSDAMKVAEIISSKIN